jgi:hypothetical protein
LKSYILNIAGYRIKIEAAEDGPELNPSARFIKYISDQADYEFLIRVHKGEYIIPPEALKVFSAPFVEEINGIRIKKKENFWSVLKAVNDLFITTDFPLSDIDKTCILRFSFASKEWDLWIDGISSANDPLEYPLDGLILYYLTVIHNDIVIHASGINHLGKGYLFSGISGKGKTTIARLWDEQGAKVVHDDRLIIRKSGNTFRMFNTPVYNNDEPASSTLDSIFILEHGSSNTQVPLSGSTAVSMLMSNCIQHNWNHTIINNLLVSVAALCDNVPVKMLYFRPEKSITDFISGNDKH